MLEMRIRQASLRGFKKNCPELLARTRYGKMHIMQNSWACHPGHNRSPINLKAKQHQSAYRMGKCPLWSSDVLGPPKLNYIP